MEYTIFDYINSALFNKKKLNTINEDESQFSLYMLNRWCSMYSPDIASVINESTNLYGKAFSSRQEQYEYALSIFPKVKRKKIEYIKKKKEEKSEELSDIPIIAQNMEISQREIKQYIDFLENTSN
jgi:hypothetical protein